MPQDYSNPVWEAPPQKRPFTRPLASGETCDLAIVGGGFLGLSTALAAARQGLSVRVIEAHKIGTGAAGLNGGQVIAGFKQDPETLVAHFGDKRGEQLIRFGATTADFVFEQIETERLAVDTCRSGWIYAAHTQAALDAMEKRDQQWRAQGADVLLIDRTEIADLTGTAGYVGGWLDRRSGTINPLAFVFELARIAAEAGVGITEGQPVRSVTKRDVAFTIQMSAGQEIRAGKVLVAANAYSDALIPGLARTIVPLHSFQIATAPLSAEQASHILPDGQAVSDSRRIIIYYRKSPDGRLVFGGRGGMSVPRAEGDWAHLEHAMMRLFPMLSSTKIEKRWFGRVAMTADHLPHLHEPEPGLMTFVGCHGRGIGMMSAMGPKIADYFSSGDRESLPFPVTPIRPIPFHAFRQVGVAATIASYRLLDALEK